MPMKLLKPDGDSDDDEEDKTGEEGEIKEEPVSDEDEEEMDQGMDAAESIKKCERVKKLVIRTDGQHFSSSFKRGSLDSIRSSMDTKMPMLDSDITHEQTELNAWDTADSVSGDSEDTNAYTNEDDADLIMQDEAEQAALAISEDSQDCQTEDEDLSSQMSSLRSSGAERHHPAYSSLPDSHPEESNSQNYELAGDSIYYGTQEPMEISSSATSHKLRRTGSDPDDVVYIPSQSPVSNDSSDVMTRNTGFIDKFNVYQPITENLSDSEENSFCPPVSSRVCGGKTMDPGKSGWGSAENAQIISDSSDQESDQEVKAQMESAINSILSLSQATPEDQGEARYAYSQSDPYYSNPSQSEESPYGEEDPGSMDQLTEEESPLHSQGEPDTDDLDSAVNSILM